MTAQTLPVPAGCEQRAMDVGDVDADGRVDVVFSAFAISNQICGIGWLQQAAAASPSPPGTSTASPAAQRHPGVAAMAAQALRATALQGDGRR